uniref:Uncharacterized protein n=1 Tax=Helianthus annuus TaxID=4232 RepID=A0A251RX53_HELAN
MYFNFERLLSFFLLGLPKIRPHCKIWKGNSLGLGRWMARLGRPNTPTIGLPVITYHD